LIQIVEFAYSGAIMHISQKMCDLKRFSLMGILWPEKFPLKNKLLEIKRKKKLKIVREEGCF
jgi:hypothetical protein